MARFWCTLRILLSRFFTFTLNQPVWGLANDRLPLENPVSRYLLLFSLCQAGRTLNSSLATVTTVAKFPKWTQLSQGLYDYSFYAREKYFCRWYVCLFWTYWLSVTTQNQKMISYIHFWNDLNLQLLKLSTALIRMYNSSVTITSLFTPLPSYTRSTAA
jgi:hypothetical protein